MTNLICTPVSSSFQVERMREIYNSNLDALATHPVPYRSYEEQQQWWEKAKAYSQAYLYSPKNMPDEYVAFMVLRQREGFKTPILAIDKPYWHCGYGKEIIRDYIIKADGPLAGEQLQSNGAICHLNQKMGWQIVGKRQEGSDVSLLLFHPGINSQKVCSSETFINILSYLGLNSDAFD